MPIKAEGKGGETCRACLKSETMKFCLPLRLEKWGILDRHSPPRSPDLSFRTASEGPSLHLLRFARNDTEPSDGGISPSVNCAKSL